MSKETVMQDEQLRDAGMDWEQVRRNGGPPCFHAEADGVLCGRAKQWEGHGVLHAYVSLAEYLRTVRAQVLREAAELTVWTIVPELTPEERRRAEHDPLGHGVQMYRKALRELADKTDGAQAEEGK